MGEAGAVKKTPLVLSFVAGFVVIVVTVYGFILVPGRRGLPRGIDPSRIVRIDGTNIEGAKDVEFVLARKKIGDDVALRLRAADGSVEEKTYRLVPYYAHTAFPLIYFLIGLFSLLLGLATFLLRPADEKARIF